jgi:hypothetical protein
MWQNTTSFLARKKGRWRVDGMSVGRKKLHTDALNNYIQFHSQMRFKSFRLIPTKKIRKVYSKAELKNFFYHLWHKK